MSLLPANHSSRYFHRLAAEHPDELGWLIGPRHWKQPRAGLFYALDNDAFTAWRERQPFDRAAWLKMIGKVQAQPFRPAWCLVPDVVADRIGTIRAWKLHAPIAAATLKCDLAFAVQDGMIAADVPSDASVVFVGGTTAWKWRTASYWCDHFLRVHIGRVNGIRRLWIAQRIGAESCDGTGFFRDPINRSKLEAWLHHQTDPQYELTL